MARTDRTSRIASSVANAVGLPGAETMLARMQSSALGSLLLGVFRARFDAAALGAAQAFEALDVAPVAPFGACAALSEIDQNNVLTALRRAEVLADPTIALALAAAARRRAPAARQGDLRLCTSARLVRLQPLTDAPKEFTPHFRLFALVSAGRDRGEHRFETDALAEHILTWLRLAEGLRREGFRIGAARVEISDLDAIAALCVAQGVRLEDVAQSPRRTGSARRRRCSRAPGRSYPERCTTFGPTWGIFTRTCPPKRRFG